MVPLSALVFVVALLALLARTIWRLKNVSFRQRPEPLNMTAVLSSPNAYRPIGRLFAPEDAAFVSELTGQESAIQGRLRRRRRRIMRLYLRQIRSDFAVVWHLARQIAPHSSNPDFGALLARQFCAFHLLLAVAHVRGLFGWGLRMPVQASALVSTMEQLRRSVFQTVAELDPETRAVLNRT